MSSVVSMSCFDIPYRLESAIPMVDGAETISAVGVTAVWVTGCTNCAAYAQTTASGINTVNTRCIALQPSLPIRPATKAPLKRYRATRNHHSRQIYVRGW
ncbi:hypothetical protein NCCNTM_43630 [Mycolicibacterium sp. NCC-Tsukiji]|nr:hypothetical protein NCCNTM_43630 [Mycolicibacterium sp. NCC-Tsukiji]